MKFTKTFFNREAAEAFAEQLRKSGCDAAVWLDMDGFRQKIYSVEWRIDE